MTRKISHQRLRSTPRPQQFCWQRWIRSLALGTIPAIFSLIPVQAAETIDFDYGPLGFSVKIDSLELYAKEGKVNRELDFYLSRVKPEAQAKFRKLLNKSYDVNPVIFYRFLRTPIGEEILTQVGYMINFSGGANGKMGIRAGLGKAAFDSEGLTLLNFFRQFPTDNIKLNTERILEVVRLVEILVKGTERMEQEMAKLSSKEAANSTPVDFSKLPDLRLTGKYSYIKQTITLNDTSRQRQLTVDIYKPQTWREGKTPVVVASHGFASNRQHFEKVAPHLASYGYVVAVPQHPGSDSTYLQDMLQGYHRDAFKLNEFIDRPLDISYVMDELERRNPTEFEGRLNLESVGVMGHSFGGYTALAIAGAQIDFEGLEQECNKVVWDPDLSLLLQCRALELPRQTYDFRDRRVQAVAVLNPVTRYMFGTEDLSKIEIPILIGAGDKDPVTPAAKEQLMPFTFLSTSDRYLALLEGEAHVDISQLDAGSTRALESLLRVKKLINPELFHTYANAMSTGFFEYYIATNADARPYLQSSYAQYISEEPFSLYLIGISSLEELKQAIEEFRAEQGLEER